MKVFVIPLIDYDPNSWWEFTLPDDYEVNINNALRLLKDARRQHRIPGKAFYVKFPNQIYYFHRKGKDEYKMYTL